MTSDKAVKKSYSSGTRHWTNRHSGQKFGDMHYITYRCLALKIRNKCNVINVM